MEQLGALAIDSVRQPCIPIRQNRSQFVANGGESSQSGFNLGKFGGGQGPHLATRCIAAVANPKNLSKFIQSEPDPQQTSHEPHPLERSRRILSIPIVRPTRRKNPFALIVSESIRADATRRGEFTRAQEV